MKTFCYSLIVLLSISAGWSRTPVTPAMGVHTGITDSVSGDTVLLKDIDVENILGEQARLVDRSSERKNDRSRTAWTYRGLSADTMERGRANLYCVFDEFTDTTSARMNYADILSQNRPLEGLTELKNVGDEAYMHTDNRNFVMIIARKGRAMVRVKVNRLTDRTSIDQLRSVVRRILPG